MSVLFESTYINKLEFKNRFVRSATYEAMADKEGRATDQLLKYIASLAKGEVGLIVTGHAHVALEGQAGPKQMGIYSDEMIDGLAEFTSVIHKHAGKTFAQLGHAGNKGIGSSEFSPLGPIDVFEGKKKIVSGMTIEDISRTVTAFGDAAQRAVKADFDGIQIHAAHGYLLSQFLSPFYNKRKDTYGGNLEGRARFLIQVYDEIRQRVGKSFPVIIKINSEDFLENGVTKDEVLQVCEILAGHGLDAVEISGGTFDSGKLTPSRAGTAKSEDREVYYIEAAKAFKQKLKIPLILVGGFLSFDIAEAIVKKGIVDYISLSRPLIREPHLIKRWKTGDFKKATCISCNKCFATLFSEEGLYCYAERKKVRQKK